MRNLLQFTLDLFDAVSAPADPMPTPVVKTPEGRLPAEFDQKSHFPASIGRLML